MANIDLIKIGNYIKKRRLEQGLSIRDLAAKSGIAASTISQIETGKTSPNITSLNAICDSLNFPVSSLFVEEDSARIKLVRKNERRTFIRNVSNGRALVESMITNGNFDMWGAVIDIPPHSDSGNYYYHEGEEFVFILKGVLEFDLENNGIYHLEEQDTIYYPNQVGHRWINESDEYTQMLIVSTTPFSMEN
ncbi:MAG: helix-turn-helix domain-containing protein [Lachnospiraceae bacterium]